MISVLNFKQHDQGALIGFFDLRYFGLTIKGCRLMDGRNGLWIAFPQQKVEQSGETKWFDQMYLTPPERQHVRRLVLADLRNQGYVQIPAGYEKPAGSVHTTPERENVSQYNSNGTVDGGMPSGYQKPAGSVYTTPEYEDVCQYNSNGTDDGGNPY